MEREQRAESDCARWAAVDVGGVSVEYLEVGSGDPLLFLHGWGLTPRTYAGAISGLTSAGVRVLAPSMPGFGRTESLPGRDTIERYAAWAADFLDAVGVDRPAFVMGHSLGGGVALRLAHDRPDVVRSLTLLNSVGGSPPPVRDGAGRRLGITSRPWWRWAVAVAAEADPRDIWSLRPQALGRLAGSIARDVLPNVVRRPRTMARSALLALSADLVGEAQEVVASGLPVLFVWGDRDRLITPGAFTVIEPALPPEVVSGRHGWLLTSPQDFAHLLRDALVVHAMLERKRRGHAVLLPKGMPLADLIPRERRHRSRDGGPDAETARR